jgi:hypothetical protein
MDLEGSANAPSGIDTNGITVFHDGYNSGKGLIIQAQANALPIPDEQRVYVTNTGVT